MTRRKSSSDHPGRAVLGPNTGETKVKKPAEKNPPKKKKKLTYLERIAECDVSEELRVSISLALKKLETSEDMKELELPSSLSSEERKYVHIVSQQMGFKSKSRGLSQDRRLVLMKKDASERPVRQRSWKRRALKYGGVEELLRQKAERRRARDLEAENDRLMKLEEEKSKLLGFEESIPDSNSNAASGKDSPHSDAMAHSSFTRFPMRRNGTVRHLHQAGLRRCSEGDSTFADRYTGCPNRNPPPQSPPTRGYHPQRGGFAPYYGPGERPPPVPFSSHEPPHVGIPPSTSPGVLRPPVREGGDAWNYSHNNLRPTGRDHYSQEHPPRFESGPIPYDFSRPPPSHPAPLNPSNALSSLRRHSLHSPAFFSTPPPRADTPSYRYYSSHGDLQSPEYNVIAPSEPKWSDYGYYTNAVGDGARPESTSSSDFYSSALRPNAPTGASVAFPPPDHTVIKDEPPEIKDEPYDPQLESYGDSSLPSYAPQAEMFNGSRRCLASSYEASDRVSSQASGSEHSSPSSPYPAPPFFPPSYSSASIKVEPCQ